MRTIIAGSRSATYNDVYEAIKSCPFKHEITLIISGTAKGADTFGEQIAEKYNIEVIKFPANWNLYGKSAGVIRNKEMAENAKALIAVWDGISKGTKNMIDIAKQLGLLIYIYNIKDITS